MRAIARRWGLRLLALTVVCAGGWIAWTDLRVRTALDHRRVAVPARLYARPLELRPGRAIDPGRLVAELEAAGYQRAPSLSRPGSYQRSGARVRVHTRSFDFPDGREPARRVEVVLAGGRVRALESAGRPLEALRLDPALVARIYPAHREDRVPVRLGDVPSELIAALIAVEDRAFPRHFGISPKAIARAALANIRAGRRLQGGSTLTQQLAKNLFLGPERTWGRKLDEALIAVMLELRYSKAEILEAYLNEVFLGQQGARAIHGFGLGARHYFGRRIDELELHEVALLVAMVKGASYYNPRRHPERARARRDLVLELMGSEGFVSARAVGEARRRPLGVTARPPPASARYPAFVDLVRRQLARDYRDADLRSSGLRIFTTLDPGAQEAAEEALAARLEAVEARGRRDLEGAVVIVEPGTGRVQAVVGGRDPRAAGFNRALDAHRPIGSLVKPAVYLSALARPEQFTLASPVLDAPVRVPRPGGAVWMPKNYDGRAHGEVPLHVALARSYNLATVRLGLDVGVDAVAGSVRRLGVARRVEPYPSLLLGALELSPLDVAAMYQTLAASGIRAPLRAIEAVTDRDGRTVARYALDARRAVDAGAVFLTVEAMRAVMTSGTGRSAYRWLDRSITAAGKTGTTDGLRDSWFAGFTGDRLAVVWIGRDDNRPTELTGATGALPVWASLMAALPAVPLSDFTPANVRWYWVLDTMATDPGCPGAVALPFIDGSAPRYLPCPDRAAGAAIPAG